MNGTGRILIRPIEPRDRGDWVRLWTGYLAFYDTVLPPEQFDLTFARLTGDDPRDYSGLIAEIDGAAAGIAHFLFHRHGWQPADVCYLQDLFVSPDHRRRGLAEALIRAVYAAADKAGAPLVYWHTAEDNHGARALYDRLAGLTPFRLYERAL